MIVFTNAEGQSNPRAQNSVQRCGSAVWKKKYSKGVLTPIQKNTIFYSKKGTFTMKFKPVYNKKFRVTASDREAFSTQDYTCMFILQTMKGRPVAVSVCNDLDCHIWRVQYGFSTVYFGEYTDAMNFCREHFCDLAGNKLEKAKERK